VSVVLQGYTIGFLFNNDVTQETQSIRDDTSQRRMSGGTSRSEAGWRVFAVLQRLQFLPPVHGPARRPGRPRARQYRSPLPGVERRVDMEPSAARPDHARLQQRLPIVGRLAADGIFEVFNLFNHEHYRNYGPNASNANFGQPAFSPSVQYFPRMLQFGVRATF
jgi:hypothetical protein